MTPRLSVLAAVATAVVPFLASGCGGSDSAQLTVTETVAATTTAGPEEQPSEPSVDPPPEPSEPTTAPSPMVVRDEEGVKLGILTLTDIYRTSTVNDYQGDFLVLSVSFENTTQNQEESANDALHVGTGLVPCDYCDQEGDREFREWFPVAADIGESRALAGQVVDFDYVVNLNKGSVRKNPKIRTLDDVWVVPRDAYIVSFPKRAARRLSAYWGSSEITEY